MTRFIPALLAVPLLALAANPGAGQDGKPLSKAFLDEARADALVLLGDLERLQEDVVLAPVAQQDRTVYRLTETAITTASRFERALKSETSQAALLKQFDAVDQATQQLVVAVRKAAPNATTLQRAADHVNRANEDLYYTVTTGDSAHAGKVTVRQAQSFTEATRDLERTAKYALAASAADRAVLLDNAAQLALAAERFEKRLHDAAALKQRQAEFGPVDKAWGQVVHDVGLLKPGENIHLIRSAARVDRLHQRLYRLLDMKGKRTGLSVQS